MIFDCLCITYRARHGPWGGKKTLLTNSINHDYGPPVVPVKQGAMGPESPPLAPPSCEPSSHSPPAELAAPYSVQYNHSPTFICCILRSSLLPLLPTHLASESSTFVKSQQAIAHPTYISIDYLQLSFIIHPDTPFAGNLSYYRRSSTHLSIHQRASHQTILYI